MGRVSLATATDIVPETCPRIILTADMVLDDLPGGSSRYGMCIRSSQAATSTGIQMCWSATSTPAAYYERRRLTSGWGPWVQVR